MSDVLKASPGMSYIDWLCKVMGLQNSLLFSYMSLAKAVLLFTLHCSKAYENTLSGGAIFTHFKVNLD